MYILTWKNPAVDPGKALSISVPVGTTVSNAASLTFTGKGAANYGKVQQENLMRLLENFADITPPAYPTVGQLWYNTSAKTLNVCTTTVPTTWTGLNGVQVGTTPPTTSEIGTLWFEPTGPLSGNFYIYNGLGRFPYSTTVNGGWEQIWPRVDAAALREEYEEMYQLIDAVMGAATTGGEGYEAIGKLFTEFADFTALDADLMTKFNGSPDENVALSFAADLRVQPVSYDWDYLLAAARWMVSRLDLPSTMTDDVSSIPFVQDGRQIPASLQVYPYDDPRSPSEERRNSRRYGTVTTTRLFAETMNVLSIVQNNKYTLKGIAGNSGVNPSFLPDVVTYAHCTRGGTWTGGSAAVVNTTFRFGSSTDRNIFANSGAAIEVVITHTASGSPTVQDNDFNAFLATHRTFRINGDRLRSFGSSLPLTLSAAPDAKGLVDVIVTPGTTTIGSRSTTAGSGTYSVSFTGTRAAGVFNINTSLSAPAGLTGTTTVEYRVIKDVTVYGASDIDLFPSPIAYNSSTDATGTSAVMANIAVTAAPVANFSVSPLSGTSGTTNFTFTWTGVGSPTLIEWDFEGTGSFTATGTTASYTYTSPGLKSVRVRATNAGGADVLTRVGYVSIEGPVIPTPPVASFTVNPNPAVGNPAIVTLVDTSLYSPTLIEWDVNNDSTYDYTDGGGASRVVTFSPGTHTIAMRATNSFGSDIATQVLTVTAPVVAPVADFTLSPNPATGNPAAVTLTDISSGSPTTIEWDFTNNGTYDAAGTAGDVQVQNYTPGSYTVKMRATNSAGSSIATKALTINSPSFLNNPYLLLGGTTATVTAQPDITASVPPIQVNASSLPTAAVTVNGSPVSGFSWSAAGTNTYSLNWPLPDSANFTVAQNGQTMVVTATTGVGSTSTNFTLNIQPRTVPAQFRWYANTGSLTSGAGTPSATVSAGAATVFLASSITGNMSNPRATSISIASGSLPPGMSLVSVSDWNSGAASTNAFAAFRVKISNNAPTTTPGTYSFTLRVNWDNSSVPSPDFTDYALTLVVT